jgi:Fe-S cluster assembly protein SufB
MDGQTGKTEHTPPEADGFTRSGRAPARESRDVEMGQYVFDRTRVNEEKVEQDDRILLDFGAYKYGWHDTDTAGARARKGIDESVVRAISADKHEPDWMLDLRLKGYRAFMEKPMPQWGVDLTGFDPQDFKYYVKPLGHEARRWEDLPPDILNTYDRLGIPQAERKRLVAGVAAQYESEVIYNSIRKELSRQGVIFCDTDTAVQKYPDLVRKYFNTVVPYDDNKFAALNTAAWSGGSFVYVPKGVHVTIPLQAYFRINTPNMGQFERTLIIADEGSYVHYVEGCTAPIYSTDSLHAAVVEIIVGTNARVRYTTVQNWSNNVYNLVTQRALVKEHGTMEWVDGNIGSKASMKYPACILAGEYAKAMTMSLSFAGSGQYQDTGAKMIHLAPHTSSTIVAKSISRGGGRSAYRGLVSIPKGSYGAHSSVVCDALLVDEFSRSDTYPHVDVREEDVTMSHEATVSKVSQDQLFYLEQRGIEEKEAMGMIVRGFVEPISRQLPMEYALELNRLVELQMEGSVG